MRLGSKVVAIAISLGMMACGGNQRTEGDTTFEELGNDAEFKEKHDEPREMEAGDQIGKMIDITVENGETAHAYAIMNENNDNYVLVFHEWWGLNNYVKQETDNWHQRLDGANMIALDLYDGKMATERDSAQKYMQSANPERISKMIDAALKMIPVNAKIGTIGWCFGGGWSLKGAIAAGERAEACVMYYGMPVQDVAELKKLGADVLFIYGKKDKWINEEVANQFAENMKKTDEELIVKGFDADHAFANPTQESFNLEAAQAANAIALEFLKEELLEEDDAEEDDDKNEMDKD